MIMASAVATMIHDYFGNKHSSDNPEKMSHEVFYQMDDALGKRWREIVGKESVLLSPDYLRALEQTGGKDMELRYVVFSDEGKDLGVAAFQITHFASSPDAFSNPVFRFFHRIGRLLRLGHIHNILICGNAVSAGEHGYCFLPLIKENRVVDALASALDELAALEKQRGKKICATVVKDFNPDSRSIPEKFGKYNYRSFRVEQNMIMPLLPEWKIFADYTADLTTKYRTRVNAVMRKSSALEVEDLTSESIIPLLPSLKKLYDNVHGKADFKLGKMNVESLPMLLKSLPDRFSVQLYRLNGRPLGFKTAVLNGDSLEAQIIGIDYYYNKDYAVYQRMLYDYIRKGIELKCQRLVLGRTASEIKSTVGALPVDLTCAMMHQDKISNALLKMIIRYVIPEDTALRQPYKSEVLKQIENRKLYD